MTETEDGQRLKPGIGFPLTEKIGKDVERTLHGQKPI